LSGTRDVGGAYVNPDVADISEVIDELARPASEIEDTRAWLGPNIVADKQASPVCAADNSRPRLIGLGDREDATNARHGEHVSAGRS
jgi:hypothetical protein